MGLDIQESDAIPCFQYMCFYKTWGDPARIGSEQEALVNLPGVNMYERLRNFTLHTTEFYDHIMK